MGQAEFFSEHEGFAHSNHRYAEDHVVAYLRRLSRAVAAAMDDFPGHGLQGRLSALESIVTAPGHESQCARRSTARAARNRRIDGKVAMSGCQFMRLASRIDV